MSKFDGDLLNGKGKDSSRVPSSSFSALSAAISSTDTSPQPSTSSVPSTLSDKPSSTEPSSNVTPSPLHTTFESSTIYPPPPSPSSYIKYNNTDSDDSFEPTTFSIYEQCFPWTVKDTPLSSIQLATFLIELGRKGFEVREDLIAEDVTDREVTDDSRPPNQLEVGIMDEDDQDIISKKFELNILLKKYKKITRKVIFFYYLRSKFQNLYRLVAWILLFLYFFERPSWTFSYSTDEGNNNNSSLSTDELTNFTDGKISPFISVSSIVSKIFPSSLSPSSSSLISSFFSSFDSYASSTSGPYWNDTASFPSYNINFFTPLLSFFLINICLLILWHCAYLDFQYKKFTNKYSLSVIFFSILALQTLGTALHLLFSIRQEKLFFSFIPFSSFFLLLIEPKFEFHFNHLFKLLTKFFMLMCFLLGFIIFFSILGFLIYPNDSKVHETYYTSFTDSLWNNFMILTSSNWPNPMTIALDENSFYFFFFFFFIIMGNWGILNIILGSIYSLTEINNKKINKKNKLILKNYYFYSFNIVYLQDLYDKAKQKKKDYEYISNALNNNTVNTSTQSHTLSLNTDFPSSPSNIIHDETSTQEVSIKKIKNIIRELYSIYIPISYPLSDTELFFLLQVITNDPLSQSVKAKDYMKINKVCYFNEFRETRGEGGLLRYLRKLRGDILNQGELFFNNTYGIRDIQLINNYNTTSTTTSSSVPPPANYPTSPVVAGSIAASSSIQIPLVESQDNTPLSSFNDIELRDSSLYVLSVPNYTATTNPIHPSLPIDFHPTPHIDSSNSNTPPVNLTGSNVEIIATPISSFSLLNYIINILIFLDSKGFEFFFNFLLVFFGVFFLSRVYNFYFFIIYFSMLIVDIILKLLLNNLKNFFNNFRSFFVLLLDFLFFILFFYDLLINDFTFKETSEEEVDPDSFSDHHNMKSVLSGFSSSCYDSNSSTSSLLASFAGSSCTSNVTNTASSLLTLSLPSLFTSLFHSLKRFHGNTFVSLHNALQSESNRSIHHDTTSFNTLNISGGFTPFTSSNSTSIAYNNNFFLQFIILIRTIYCLSYFYFVLRKYYKKKSSKKDDSKNDAKIKKKLLILKKFYKKFLFLLLSFFSILFFFSIIALNMFGGDIIKTGSQGADIAASNYGVYSYWPLNFNDLPSALGTLFVLLHVNNTHIISSGFEAARNSTWPRIFFTLWYTIGVLLFLNILIASFLSNFSNFLEVLKESEEEEKEEEKEEELLEFRKKQLILEYEINKKENELGSEILKQKEREENERKEREKNLEKETLEIFGNDFSIDLYQLALKNILIATNYSPPENSEPPIAITAAISTKIDSALPTTYFISYFFSSSSSSTTKQASPFCSSLILPFSSPFHPLIYKEYKLLKELENHSIPLSLSNKNKSLLKFIYSPNYSTINLIERGAVLLQFARDGREHSINFSSLSLDSYRLRSRISPLLRLVSYFLIILRIFERPVWTYFHDDWDNKDIFPRSLLPLAPVRLLCFFYFFLLLFLELGVFLEILYKNSYEVIKETNLEEIFGSSRPSEKSEKFKVKTEDVKFRETFLEYNKTNTKLSSSSTTFSNFFRNLIFLYGIVLLAVYFLIMVASNKENSSKLITEFYPISYGNVIFFIWFNRKSLEKIKIIFKILPKLFQFVLLFFFFLILFAYVGYEIFLLKDIGNIEGFPDYYNNFKTAIWSTLGVITSSSFPSQIMPGYKKYRELIFYILILIIFCTFFLLNVILIIILIEFYLHYNNLLAEQGYKRKLLLIRCYYLLVSEQDSFSFNSDFKLRELSDSQLTASGSEDYLTYEIILKLIEELYDHYSDFQKDNLLEARITTIDLFIIFFRSFSDSFRSICCRSNKRLENSSVVYDIESNNISTRENSTSIPVYGYNVGCNGPYGYPSQDGYLSSSNQHEISLLSASRTYSRSYSNSYSYHRKMSIEKDPTNNNPKKIKSIQKSEKLRELKKLLVCQILDLNNDEKICLHDFLYILDVLKIKLKVNKKNINYSNYLERIFPSLIDKKNNESNDSSENKIVSFWYKSYIYIRDFIQKKTILFNFASDTVINIIILVYIIVYFDKYFKFTALAKTLIFLINTLLIAHFLLNFFVGNLNSFGKFIKTYKIFFRFIYIILLNLFLTLYFLSSNYQRFLYICVKVLLFFRFFLYPFSAFFFFLSNNEEVEKTNQDLEMTSFNSSSPTTSSHSKPVSSSNYYIKLSKIFYKILKKVYTLGSVFFILFYFFTTYGIYLFGGVIRKDLTENELFANSLYVQYGYFPLNFNDFFSSVMTLFAALHVSDFDIVATGFFYAKVGNKTIKESDVYYGPRIFFAFWYVIGVLLMLNILKAFFMKEFFEYFKNLNEDNQIEEEAKNSAIANNSYTNDNPSVLSSPVVTQDISTFNSKLEKLTSFHQLSSYNHLDLTNVNNSVLTDHVANLKTRSSIAHRNSLMSRPIDSQAIPTDYSKLSDSNQSSTSFSLPANYSSNLESSINQTKTPTSISFSPRKSISIPIPLQYLDKDEEDETNSYDEEDGDEVEINMGDEHDELDENEFIASTSAFKVSLNFHYF